MPRVLQQRELRSRRLRDLLEGSPTLAVVSPIRVTGWWPKRLNQERTMRPRWRD